MISNIYERIVGVSPPPEPNEPKILCVGQSCLDIVQLCKNYPQEDSDMRYDYVVRGNSTLRGLDKDVSKTLLCMDFRYQRGGNACNNCTVLSQLEQSCEFFGFLSNQQFSTFLQEDMRKYKIDFSHCPVTDEHECPKSVVILSMSTGSRTIIHHNPNFPEVTLKDFEKLNLEDYSWIHFEGRNVSEIILMMQHIENYNKSIAQKESENTDPSTHHLPITISVEIEKMRPDLLDTLPYVDAAFISKDFALSRGYVNMSETLKNMSQESKTGATIFSAWADLGAMARGPDGTIVQSPAFPPHKVIDTLGAGDTFNAAVIHYLNKQKLAYQKNGNDVNNRSPKNNVERNYNIESSEKSQTEFINREVLQDAITFGCRLAGAKIGFRGLDGINKIYKHFM